MGWPVRVQSPPVLQSKLLCLSLLYLLTTLPPALYVSFAGDPGRRRCLRLLPSFPSPPSKPLFRYPLGYGEHRHALPTPRALCSNPVAFAGLPPSFSPPIPAQVMLHRAHRGQAISVLSCVRGASFLSRFRVSSHRGGGGRSTVTRNDRNYKTALEEIHGLCRNTSASPAWRYQSGQRTTFAGNFSTVERRSFFSHTDDQVAVPCGFFREFPVPEHDKLAMERCRGVVVASAIMNDHDKVRQPRGLGSETLRTACFFLFIDDATRGALARQGVFPARDAPGGEGGVHTAVGAWRVVTLGRRRGGGGGGRLPYEDPAMNGVVAKHLLHRLFPNARFSVWVDGKVQLTVDPALLVHALLVRERADVAVSRHPFNRHTMEEAIATARWRKWRDVDAVRAQMETYCANGLQPWSPGKLPYPSDVPDTAVIIRRHGVASDLFSCLLFNELEAFSPRDQLAFAYVRDQMSPKVSINMFEVEVFEQIVVEYRHNLKRGTDRRRKQQQGATKMASSRDIVGSSCESYLLKMWGESAD